ncbi:DUF3450 domain-containing protein [Fretibacter rubidus]|uniref:DUF3450 domain-containing protein n=1 Tax=Fretibacter rubidus TaxID=570162 RepID=UPI00352B9D3B
MSNFSIAKHLLLAGAAAMAFAVPAHAQLDTALNTAKASTAASAASQQRVERDDDDADQMIREYRAVLQQKDNIALFVDQQDIYLQSQTAEIESLNKQLGTVEQIKQGMVPMMLKMAAALEDSIKADLPFRLNERLERVERIQTVLGDPEVSPAEQYRQVLNGFKIEVTYGQGLDAYEGAHPTRPGNIVNFLRFGRTALVYVTKDESEVARYNLESNSWEPMSSGEALALRQAVRVANGEAAPDMVYAPVVVGQ